MAPMVQQVLRVPREPMASDGSPGAVGPSGPAGMASGPCSGPTGSNRTRGPAGPGQRSCRPRLAPAATTRSSSWQRSQGTILPLTATCNPGDVAVGGGFEGDVRNNLFILGQKPAPLVMPVSWVVTVDNNSGQARAAGAYVVCLDL